MECLSLLSNDYHGKWGKHLNLIVVTKWGLATNHIGIALAMYCNVRQPDDYCDYIEFLEPQVYERCFQNNHRHSARRRCGRFRKCKSRIHSMI